MLRTRLDPPFAQALLDSVACLVLLLDRDGTILFCNEACQAMAGNDLQHIEGCAVWDVLVPPDRREEVRTGLERLWDRRGSCRYELAVPRPGGRPSQVAWSSVVMRDAESGLEYVLATGMDMTGLRSAQEELREAHDRLRTVMESLIRAQEDERRRVAYDVHDGLLQYIVGAQMHLSALEAQVLTCRPEVQAELARVRERIGQAISEGRRIIAALRPSTLDDYGLVETLRRELKGLRKDGWQVTFQARVDRPLPPHQEINLYRMFQEALHNAVKHAQTRRLRVDLSEGDGLVRLRVRDWGQGFDTVATPPGMGLRTLRERAELFRGACRVSSAPGEGTTVEVSLPRARDAEAQASQLAQA